MRNNLTSINRTLALTALLFIYSVTVAAQSAKEMRGIFAQAEAYFLYEEYELANPLYLMLEDETNYNIKYKIGVCYLNIPGEKANAIPYLEEAVLHSSFNAKINKLTEKNAPFDSYFFLAKAYMINNDLEKDSPHSKNSMSCQEVTK